MAPVLVIDPTLTGFVNLWFLFNTASLGMIKEFFFFFFCGDVGFHVGRNATVSRLKIAVEEEFKISLNDEGNSLWHGPKILSFLFVKISQYWLYYLAKWLYVFYDYLSYPSRPLVWSHFCLCYQNHKLINDRACIQSYGIRDGDQVSMFMLWKPFAWLILLQAVKQTCFSILSEEITHLH